MVTVAGVAEPGWYPDPSNHARRRWWDGSQWSEYVDLPLSHLPPPPTAIAPASSLQADLDGALATGRQAATWLWVAAAIAAFYLVVSAFMFHGLFEGFFDMIDEASTNAGRYPGSRVGTTGTTGTPFTSVEDDLAWMNLASPLLNLLQLGQLAIGVLFAVWLYKAAKLADRLGLRGGLQPYWAILGFIVPIVNLWFPLLVARDCLPPGHPGRRSALAWWLLYMGASLSGVGVLFLSLVSLPLAVTAALVAAGIGFMAVVKARDTIGAIGSCHTDLVGRVTGGISGAQGVARWEQT